MLAKLEGTLFRIPVADLLGDGDDEGCPAGKLDQLPETGAPQNRQGHDGRSCNDQAGGHVVADLAALLAGGESLRFADGDLRDFPRAVEQLPRDLDRVHGRQPTHLFSGRNEGGRSRPRDFLPKHYAVRSRLTLAGGSSARGTSVGAAIFWTTSFVTTHFCTSSREGSSYITGRRTSSMIARRPRAPVPRFIASSETSSNASCSNASSTPSNSNDFAYCFTSAFLGSVRISTSALRSSWCTLVTTGSRPTNSGIRPNFKRSSGITCVRIVPTSFSSILRTSAPKPIPRWPTRPSMIFSRPANAPPQMKSTFVVSIWMNSWCGCLRPPCGGTLACVPSRIFSSACWTPSPDTSRVIDGFSLLRAILSTSSM